jgi:hypothetical protein
MTTSWALCLSSQFDYSTISNFFLKYLFGILYFGHCNLFDICYLEFRLSYLYSSTSFKSPYELDRYNKGSNQSRINNRQRHKNQRWVKEKA